MFVDKAALLVEREKKKSYVYPKKLGMFKFFGFCIFVCVTLLVNIFCPGLLKIVF